MQLIGMTEAPPATTDLAGFILFQLHEILKAAHRYDPDALAAKALAKPLLLSLLVIDLAQSSASNNCELLPRDRLNV